MMPGKYKPPKDHPWRRTLHALFLEDRAKKRKVKLCFWCGATSDMPHAAGCPTKKKA